MWERVSTTYELLKMLYVSPLANPVFYEDTVRIIMNLNGLKLD